MKKIQSLARGFIFLLMTGIGILTIILSYDSDAISTRPISSGIYHKVSMGETAWDLARHYKTSLQAILQSNKIENPKKEVQVGTKLFIPGAKQISPQKGISYRVKSGDTVWDISERYGIPKSDILGANKLPPSGTIFPGQKLFLPGAKEPRLVFGSPLKDKLTVTSGYGYRIHPVSGQRLFHHGIDLRAKEGTRIYAAQAGKVIFVGWLGGYGRLVVIKHDDKYTTRYGHLAKITVRSGQKVKSGTVIGLSGDTGYSTGPHLHFEVRCKGKSIDPAKYVQPT
ncbi:M23 family metallopeptidase [Candidatus Poribacteria bacterium]|nr:M23 family metallopeptidase [Candidatus Poribacteria bacterium]